MYRRFCAETSRMCACECSQGCALMAADQRTRFREIVLSESGGRRHAASPASRELSNVGSSSSQNNWQETGMRTFFYQKPKTNRAPIALSERTKTTGARWGTVSEMPKELGGNYEQLDPVASTICVNRGFSFYAHVLKRLLNRSR